MNEYYSFKQAMELLGLKSTNVFRQLERKYPEAFVNLNPTTHRHSHPWYDKAALDEFAKAYHRFKQEKP